MTYPFRAAYNPFSVDAKPSSRTAETINTSSLTKPELTGLKSKSQAQKKSTSEQISDSAWTKFKVKVEPHYEDVPESMGSNCETQEADVKEEMDHGKSLCLFNP